MTPEEGIEKLAGLISDMPGSRFIGEQWKNDPIVTMELSYDENWGRWTWEGENRRMGFRFVDAFLDAMIAAYGPFRESPDEEHEIDVPLFIAEVAAWNGDSEQEGYFVIDYSVTDTALEAAAT